MPVQWDDLSLAEKRAYEKRVRLSGRAGDAELKREERDLQRAEMGDMEDD
jgi:hypothetical protein